MKKILIGLIGWVAMGCDADQYHRGYVISQTHLEEEVNEEEPSLGEQPIELP